MLSPEFFTSATVNLLPVTAMVTFAGLWCYADDFGRCEDDVTMVKATIWPRRRGHSETKVARDLDEIEGVGLICRYVVAEVPLMHLISWHEHQKISHRAPSKLPPCRDHEPGMWEEFLRDSGGPLDKFRSVSGVAPERLQSEVVQGKSIEGSSSGDGPKLAREAVRSARRAS
jgi:hypothetical protein